MHQSRQSGPRRAKPEAEAARRQGQDPGLLDAEEKDGTRVKPEFGSVWYHLMGPDHDHARPHMTIAVPGATSASMGLPDNPKQGGVWIMNAGTSTAHLMTPANNKSSDRDSGNRREPGGPEIRAAPLVLRVYSEDAAFYAESIMESRTMNYLLRSSRGGSAVRCPAKRTFTGVVTDDMCGREIIPKCGWGRRTPSARSPA